MRDARKLFRLFKSVNEAHKILEILNKGGSDEVGVVLDLLNRLAFLMYWIFDNIAILGTIKFLSIDPKKYIWCFLLVLGIDLLFGANRQKIELP